MREPAGELGKRDMDGTVCMPLIPFLLTANIDDYGNLFVLNGGTSLCRCERFGGRERQAIYNGKHHGNADEDGKESGGIHLLCGAVIWRGFLSRYSLEVRPNIST
jgi:hypothetical protein